MNSNRRENQISKKMLWTSYVISVLPSLLLLADGVAKLFKPAPVVEGTINLGYPESTIVGMGIVLLVSTILYLSPPTAVLGAILLTGYLGGAVATHVRVGNPPLISYFQSFSVRCCGADFTCAIIICAHSFRCEPTPPDSFQNKSPR